MSTFLILGCVGLAILALSLILGDIADGIFDAFDSDIFSTSVIGAFLAAFGFGAELSANLGSPLPLTLAIGAAAGSVFGWFATWLTRLLKDGHSDGTPQTSDVLGRDATVVSAIPAEGFGKVRVLLGGHVMRLNASAEQPLESGTEVHVTQILSPTAVQVKPTWPEIEIPDPPQ